MTSTGTAGGWTVCRRRDTHAAGRLYVFPHSGGSPGEYVRWADEAPGVEVWGVQLPGRGARAGEAPLRSMAAIVGAIVAEARFDPPFVFFGHSLGGLVAHEVALALRDRGLPGPVALLPSAIPAPHHGLRRPPLRHLPDDELVRALDDVYGTFPEPLRSDRDLLGLVLPAHRADLEVYETYRHEPRPVLDVPIHVFGGRDDDIEHQRLADWARHTSGAFTLTMAPGGHFYLREPRARATVLRAVAAALPTTEEGRRP